MGRRVQGQTTPITWDQLSEKERNNFTMGGTIPMIDWFIDGITDAQENDFWDTGYIEELVQKAYRREENYYHETDSFLCECLDTYDIEGKSVAIMGSVEPWYEAVVLSRGGIPTTIEYNKLKTNDKRLNLLTVEEYNKKPKKFDIAFSISSFEHDGLGRYGDPINPEGDFEAMKNVKKNVLKKGGLLFLAVPIGADKICWNAHRVYGTKRFPKLIQGFEKVYSAGLSDNDLSVDRGQHGGFQPVVVLKND